MKTRYSPRATKHLQDLYTYVELASGSDKAGRFVGSIVDYCERVGRSPYRGTKRDDIRPGLRIVGFQRRVTIAFSVTNGAPTILGVFYGGRNFEAVLRG